MTIDELNALTTLTAADEVPVWDSEESSEPTKKITASNLAASVKSLASLPNTTEMNNAIQQSTAALTTREKLTVTYTQNQYVTSSNIGISVTRVGKAYAIDVNLWLSNEYSADSPVEIGRIINYNAAKPIRMQIPNGAYTMLLVIYDNGIISLGRITPTIVKGWYRFGATAVKWD